MATIRLNLPKTDGTNCPQCGVSFSNGDDWDRVRNLCHLHNRWECKKCADEGYKMKHETREVPR